MARQTWALLSLSMGCMLAPQAIACEMFNGLSA